MRMKTRAGRPAHRFPNVPRSPGRLGAAAIAVALSVTGAVYAAGPAAAASCIGSGDTAGITAALSGQGAAAVLCPGAVFNLTGPITFTAANQQIYTQGLPTGSTRATLVVTGSTQSAAIEGSNKSGITVENVQINGNRPALGRIASGSALIEIGGNATGQTVQHVYAYETRGWSTIHIGEGAVTNSTPTCQNAKILNNTIAEAGTGSPSGTWSDGISLACGTTEVEGNAVNDATDGGIVIFGAPGSTISGNTITALAQTELGGINMVDYGPLNGNYTGTVVKNNVIDGKSAFIKVGIAMGPRVWSCATGTNYGASVTGNTIEGENVGYGYVVNGVANWTVTGNSDTARHVGVAAGACGGTTAAPAPYLADTAAASSSTLQSQFVSSTHVEYLLGVSEPSILTVPQAPTACGTMTADQGLYPGQQLTSCDGRFALYMQGDGNLVLREGGTALWASNTNGHSAGEALMQGDGNFVVYDATGTADWTSGTANHSGAKLDLQNDGNLVVRSSSGTALWASNTSGH